MSYVSGLYDKFSHIRFDLVYFDNGQTPQCMQLYLRASGLTRDDMKNKGKLVLDLGNYVFRRFGIVYEHPPEFDRSSSEENTLAFYQSKKKFNAEYSKHLRDWIMTKGVGSCGPEGVLYKLKSIEIPHVPPYKDLVAVIKATGEIVIIREEPLEPTLVIRYNDSKYIKAEVGSYDVFEVIGVL